MVRLPIAMQRKATPRNHNGSCIEAGLWRKSSSCAGGSCVEVGAWKVSSRCESGACVETSSDGYVVHVRDTKVSTVIGDAAPVLTFSLRDWVALIRSEKRYGHIAATMAAKEALATTLPSGATFRQVPRGSGSEWRMSDQPGIVLSFTPAEVAAWSAGVSNEEFDLSPGLRELVAV